MELTNEFWVGVGPADAFGVLTDVERIAPCMPGAELQEIEGDEYRGIVKVKVGPITAQYKGVARFLERDEAGGKVVLKAEGRETKGQGTASATVTATLKPDGDGTKVSVVTELNVTGRVAQFGRGVMADVSAKLLQQFVDCVESTILGPQTGNGGAAGAEPEPAAEIAGGGAFEVAADRSAGSESSAVDTSASTAGPRRIEGPPAIPVDLVQAAGGAVAKRAAIAGAVVLAVLMLLRLFRRRRTDDG